MGPGLCRLSREVGEHGGPGAESVGVGRPLEFVLGPPPPLNLDVLKSCTTALVTPAAWVVSAARFSVSLPGPSNALTGPPNWIFPAESWMLYVLVPVAAETSEKLL